MSTAAAFRYLDTIAEVFKQHNLEGLSERSIDEIKTAWRETLEEMSSLRKTKTETENRLANVTNALGAKYAEVAKLEQELKTAHREQARLQDHLSEKINELDACECSHDDEEAAHRETLSQLSESKIGSKAFRQLDWLVRRFELEIRKGDSGYCVKIGSFDFFNHRELDQAIESAYETKGGTT